MDLLGVTLFLLCAISATYSDDGFMGSVDGKAQNRLKDGKVVQDKGHLKEHLDESANVDFDNMSNKEISFHYFKLHDVDQNNKLDGLELLWAFLHGIQSDEGDVKKTEEERAKARQSREEMVMATLDITLKEFDANDDGYIDYVEFGNSIDRQAEKM